MSKYGMTDIREELHRQAPRSLGILSDRRNKVNPAVDHASWCNSLELLHPQLRLSRVRAVTLQLMKLTVCLALPRGEYRLISMAGIGG